ncbi:hypothetical protein K438DRAFT_1973701 [Mycena galopus ATCC 62051]|nr:hypothetical protein K438DRAFT_1973701 [Mycena galopus ATCC 62051]
MPITSTDIFWCTRLSALSAHVLPPPPRSVFNRLADCFFASSLAHFARSTVYATYSNLLRPFLRRDSCAVIPAYPCTPLDRCSSLEFPVDYVTTRAFSFPPLPFPLCPTNRFILPQISSQTSYSPPPFPHFHVLCDSIKCGDFIGRDSARCPICLICLNIRLIASDPSPTPSLSIPLPSAWCVSSLDTQWLVVVGTKPSHSPSFVSSSPFPQPVSAPYSPRPSSPSLVLPHLLDLEIPRCDTDIRAKPERNIIPIRALHPRDLYTAPPLRPPRAWMSPIVGALLYRSPLTWTALSARVLTIQSVPVRRGVRPRAQVVDWVMASSDSSCLHAVPNPTSASRLRILSSLGRILSLWHTHSLDLNGARSWAVLIPLAPFSAPNLHSLPPHAPTPPVLVFDVLTQLSFESSTAKSMHVGLYGTALLAEIPPRPAS